MKNYDEMSSIEIASSVLADKNIQHKIECGTCFIYDGYEDGACMYSAFDPCNRAQDAWNIFNEARIEIKRDTCQAHVSSYFNPEFVIHCRNDEKEILRASMICFLKMKDAE